MSAHNCAIYRHKAAWIHQYEIAHDDIFERHLFYSAGAAYESGLRQVFEEILNLAAPTGNGKSL